jgi:hypothetical protein
VLQNRNILIQLRLRLLFPLLLLNYTATAPLHLNSLHLVKFKINSWKNGVTLISLGWKRCSLATSVPLCLFFAITLNCKFCFKGKQAYVNPNAKYVKWIILQQILYYDTRLCPDRKWILFSINAKFCRVWVIFVASWFTTIYPRLWLLAPFQHLAGEPGTTVNTLLGFNGEGVTIGLQYTVLYTMSVFVQQNCSVECRFSLRLCRVVCAMCRLCRCCAKYLNFTDLHDQQLE